MSPLLPDSKPYKPITEAVPVSWHEVVARVERGLSPETVAVQMGITVEEVYEHVRSPKGRSALAEMRAARELALLKEREDWRVLRKRSNQVLLDGLDDPEAKLTDKLRIAHMVYERDPDRVFTKTDRKEVSHRHELHYDPTAFTTRAQTIIDTTASTPPSKLLEQHGAKDGIMVVEDAS